MLAGFLSRAQRVTLLFFLVAFSGWAEAQTLRVAVLDNSPPLSFRDSSGKLSGFSAEIVRAICEEMQVTCALQVTTLDHVVDLLVQDEIDIAAVSLLDTPERRSKILLARPYFRSISLWIARPGIEPAHPGVRVAVVKGSAQERYALKQGWSTIAVPTNGLLVDPLVAGSAQALIAPMSTAISLKTHPAFNQQGLAFTVMQAPELGGDASFGINPRRADIKKAVDDALERIKRNGVYDRINTQFLPFRVS